ncbi:MAG: hypothetical protein HOV94_00630 [Saccharothrix sp.]|nr:hypothetical protein [Saccharothrix sp.]
MSQTYSYADAVKILGAKENRILAALDRMVGGALLSGATLGMSDLLGWFDAKADFVRTAHELLVKAAERRSGLNRFSRTERLQAAHAVIVVVAFFESLPTFHAPLVGDLNLSRHEQLDFVGLHSLFDGVWPLPSAALPYEDVVKQLKDAYAIGAESIGSFVTGLAIWDKLNASQRRLLHRSLRKLPDAAVGRYRELLRQLASEYPELRFWFQVEDNVAARAALARLEHGLRQVLQGSHPDARRADLARRYRAALDKPVIELGRVQEDLRVPLLRDSYVDPDFQVARMSSEAKPHMLPWWSKQVRRADLYRYLASYLTSNEATRHPLIVLGDPGSGKSLLTKVLAARLPPENFLTVRVELRGTPAEADLLDQIEHGVRTALREHLAWAELARSAGAALPVVMLDGLDELLQATGVTQSRYLLKVQQFQHECAEAGYPVSIVVTSRISVISAVQIPADAHVLRLMPFTQEQITRWLTTWNSANFQSSDVRAPLHPTVAFRYMELAQQPLLLFMLALYDAEDNALQREQTRLRESELYERLVGQFVQREVGKQSADRHDDDFEEDVEAELERLSVTGFAMFNRRVQWVAETDLNDDLVALFETEQHGRRPGMSTPLGAGEALLGRFFFVQRAEAIRDSRILRTYEFLHATFGEFLIARFIWRILSDLLAVELARPRRQASSPVDDGELATLLSFSPLSSRMSILDFLYDLADTRGGRVEVLGLLKRIFRDSHRSIERSRKTYQPSSASSTSRHAVYSLNLVLLYGTIGGPFDARELDIDDWPRLTALWKSQLPPDEWRTLILSVGVRWTHDRSVVLFGESGQPGLDELTRLVDPESDLHQSVAESTFTADPVPNSFRYILEDDSIETVRLQDRRGVFELAAVFASRWTRAETYLRWADRLPDLVVNRVAADLAVSPATRSQIMSTRAGRVPAFWPQLFARIGRGGEDEELLALCKDVESHVTTIEPAIAALDAWLRLCEANFPFRDDREYPDLEELVARLPLSEIHSLRPDLTRRLGHERSRRKVKRHRGRG